MTDSKDKVEVVEEVNEVVETAEGVEAPTAESTAVRPERKERPNYQNRDKGERNFSKDKSFYKRGAPRRRVCNFCVNKVDEIDYIKLAQEINKTYSPHNSDERRPRYITEKGRILPRRMSGVCVKHQRALATAVKRARIMALLPFQAD